MILPTRWSMELRGLVVGGLTTPYPWTPDGTPTGLGAAPVKAADVEPPTDDGAYAAGDAMAPRRITARVWVKGVSPADAEAKAFKLSGAWRASATDLELSVRMAGETTRVAYGRPRRCEVDLSTLRHGHVSAALEFKAMDPRLYSAVETPTLVPLGPAISGGLTFPITFPAAFQEPGAPPPGRRSITNRGSVDSPPIIAIQGGSLPTDNPWLENTTTGEVLALQTTINPGDIVIVDMRARSITVNGGPALGIFAPGSRWWRLAPGPNFVAFRAAVEDTGALATFHYRHAD